MMTTGLLPEAETTPLACSGSVFVAAIQLNVLHGVAEAELVDTETSSCVSIDLHNRESINQLLSIGLVGLH